MSYGYSHGGPGGGYGQAPPPQQQQGYGGGYGGGGAGYGGQGGYAGGGGSGGGGQYGQGGGGGGYRPQAYSQHGGPPPGADQQLWTWFVAVDRDQSGHINPIELQQALVNGDWSPFELDTVKLLMTMFDTDRSGSITFNEFAGLWKYIQDWQGVFRHFDQDRSGTIDQGELARALSNFGYNLNPRLLQVVVQKFGEYIDGTVNASPSSSTSSSSSRTTATANHRNTITFDRFVRCCVVIKTLTDSFVRRDTQRTGRITLTYDE